jgi:hypothetical protein
MLVITQSHIDARLSRNADLLADAARDRLVTAASQSSPTATPRPAGRIRAGLRHAGAALLRNDALFAEAAVIVSLVALASIG